MRANRNSGADDPIKDGSRLTRPELVRRMQKDPDNVPLLASLADAYLEEGNHAKALHVSGRAYALAPKNPLVWWDHARALYMNGQYAEAVALHKKTLKTKVAATARSMCWSVRLARQFRNTSRFDLALCYIQLDKASLAMRLLRDYIASCGHSGHYYSPDLAKAKLRSLGRLRSQAKRQSIRLWISLIQIKVECAKRRTKHRRGYTNGLAMARNQSEAITAMRVSLSEMGYRLVRSEGTEEFERRMLKTELPDSTRKLAEKVRKDRTPRFTEFCMYPSTK